MNNSSLEKKNFGSFRTNKRLVKNKTRRLGNDK